MGCWEMLFWLLIAAGAFELVAKVINGLIIRSIVRHCKTLAEVEEAALLVKKEK